MNAPVIVVGGGIAGLVVARRVAMAGREVTLLEAREVLGGTVARHSVGGIELDAGAEGFSNRAGTVRQLATELGLADAIVAPNPAGAWLHSADGRANRLPELSLLGIPGSPLATDVVEIIGAKAAGRAFLETLLPGVVGARAATLGELVRLRMGDAVVEQLVAPIARGVHAVGPDELALDTVAPGLRAALRRTGSLARAVRAIRTDGGRAGSAIGGLRGGVVRIVDELIADIDRLGVTVLPGSMVTSVEPDRVSLRSRELEGTVVLAAPGFFGVDVSNAPRTTLVTLVVDQSELDVAPRGTGVLVAHGASGVVARALTHSTAKWSWLAERAGGKHILRLAYEGFMDARDDTVRADASALLGVPLLPSQLIDSAAVTWSRPPLRQHAIDGIYAVGETVAGTGLASTIAHAEAQAAKLLGDSQTEQR